MLLTAYCGNKSVDWKVPFPLYLIIKSSNLVANLLVGRLGFAKIYGLGQVAGVLLMTAGFSIIFWGNWGNISRGN